MFGIGAGELIVIMALALIIVGPQRLPEVGRTLGRVVGEFKAHTDELRSVMSFDAPVEKAGQPAPGGSQTFIGISERIAAMQGRTSADGQGVTATTSFADQAAPVEPRRIEAAVEVEPVVASRSAES